MAISKNIKSGRIIAKTLGVDKRFLYKAVKKRDKLLSFNMILWGSKELLPRLDLFGVSERIGAGLVNFRDDHFTKQKGCSPFA
jgi:hypothetical protein